MSAKYQVIIDYIKEEIKVGKIKKGDKILTEKELSDKFDVSRITSKRAIDDLVKEGIIERVRGKGSFYLGEVKESSEMVVEHSNKKSKIVAMIFDINDSFGLQYIKGASKALSEKGYMLSPYFIKSQDKAEENMVIEKVKNHELDGIIFYPQNVNEEFHFIMKCKLHNIPLVSIDKTIDYFDVDSVVSDNFLGGYKIAETLIKKGHKRIAQVYSNYPSMISSVMDRFKGIMQAFADYDIPMETDKIFYNTSRAQQEEIENNRYNEFLDSLKDNYTAIICENDVIAEGVKKRVDGFELTGFDNLKKSGLIDVSWITVEQDFETVGEEAAKLLIERIEKPLEPKKIVKVDIKLLNA